MDFVRWTAFSKCTFISPLAPRASSAFTTSKFPRSAAKCSGVYPCNVPLVKLKRVVSCAPYVLVQGVHVFVWVRPEVRDQAL